MIYKFNTAVVYKNIYIKELVTLNPVKEKMWVEKSVR